MTLNDLHEAFLKAESDYHEYLDDMGVEYERCRDPDALYAQYLNDPLCEIIMKISPKMKDMHKAAELYVIARDKGVDGAMLHKLSWQ